MNADLIRRQRHGRDRDRGNRGGDRQLRSMMRPASAGATCPSLSTS
jgi:hypothetical protein